MIFGMELWAAFLWLPSCSRCPLYKALGWDSAATVGEVCLVCAPRNTAGAAAVSRAARSPEFLAVAMKLWVYLLARVSPSLIPAVLLGKGKTLCVGYNRFMSLRGSEFGMVSAFQ